MGTLYKNAKFEMGNVVVTRGVYDYMKCDLKFSEGVRTSIRRHSEGDWGDLCDEDKQANDDALVNGDRILSSYEISDMKIWIITEWDRSVTTILFPSEY